MSRIILCKVHDLYISLLLHPSCLPKKLPRIAALPVTVGEEEIALLQCNLIRLYDGISKRHIIQLNRVIMILKELRKWNGI